ncbi:MAG: hypothetical protein M1377_02655 [Deltaproteobacteria bacterium]|nr:hypothetical protein [Deltaproteobacteria bacterium]
MKKAKTKNQTVHIPGKEETTLCGKPVASATIWAKKSSPTKDHPGLCKKCFALFAKTETVPPEPKAKKKAAKPDVENKLGKRTPVLAAFPNHPAELVVTYKGTTYKAAVNPDGTITVDGKTFNSPSRAGKEVIGKEVDGWTFWSYEVEGEGLKKLDTLRKSGT